MTAAAAIPTQRLLSSNSSHCSQHSAYRALLAHIAHNTALTELYQLTLLATQRLLSSISSHCSQHSAYRALSAHTAHNTAFTELYQLTLLITQRWQSSISSHCSQHSAYWVISAYTAHNTALTGLHHEPGPCPPWAHYGHNLIKFLTKLSQASLLHDTQLIAHKNCVHRAHYSQKRDENTDHCSQSGCSHGLVAHMAWLLTIVCV